MALIGTFYGTTNNEFVQPKIEWVGVQSIADNYTDVTANLYYSRTNKGYTTQGTWNGKITINGTSTSGGPKSVEVTYNSNTFVLTATTRVYHGTDGTKSIEISATGAISGSSVSSTTISATVTLDTIPKPTKPTVSSQSVNMGSPVTISMARASSSFTHNLTYSFGSLTGQTSGLSASTGVGTSATFTPPLTLANQIPNDVSGICTITCDTYSGSTLIGTETVNITLTLRTDVVPTISEVAIWDASGQWSTFEAYVQNKSTLGVHIYATGVYNSPIVKYETTILGIKYTGDQFTSGVLTAAGSVSVAVAVTDSRGRTATHTSTISVLSYFAPKINGLTALRINTSGEADPNGTRLAVAMNFEIAAVGEKNNKTYQLQYKTADAETFTTFATVTPDSWVYDDLQLFTDAPEISVNNAYVIKLIVTDYFGSATAYYEISTAYAILDVRNTGKGLAVGKVSEKDAFEVGMDADFKGAVKMYAPTTGVADSHLIEMCRSNGKRLAIISTADLGNGLRFHQYNADGTWTSSITFTPDGQISAPGNIMGNWLMSTWLKTTGTTDLGYAPGRVCVLDENGWIYTRTPAELRSDMGIQSGTTTTGASIQYIGNMKIVTGTFNVTYYADTEAETAVDFGVTFTSAPVVIVTQVFNTSNIIVRNGDITTTGFTARVPAVGASGSRATKYIAVGI